MPDSRKLSSKDTALNKMEKKNPAFMNLIFQEWKQTLKQNKTKHHMYNISYGDKCYEESDVR